MNNKEATEFVSKVAQRGLGIYGRIRVVEICLESNCKLLEDNTVNWLTDDIDKAVSDFIINFSKPNQFAKMTVMLLAKKYDIPLPDELTKSKIRKSRFRKLLYTP